ncbi:hypothetical protein DYBT9275_00788 [Dyadobacter sp. CECT 9275]|uniref:Uncharacterized protein n=1 Tax=Dyadobacter helix TaxID=2822344 RepID=A0A916NAN3_9BACT|nr:hypothetical protein [Dyadobacter sp. CECT 9275]CAG4991600.1 hypothetical protein DYBT9275_00788 [Dyadobacter sp. CECT 9275]
MKIYRSVFFLFLYLIGCAGPWVCASDLVVNNGALEKSGPELTDTPKIREFLIQENDTLSYTLKLVLDEAGHPQYFFRNIFTPVCYTNECKPVYINFYWDLLGNYMRYDLPKNKVLTKVDHDEFKEEDYQKLSEILAKSNSIFADLKMEDLITKGTDNLTDNVDAKTGATLKTIKNEVIDGAVYTCFTLWHIAHGRASEEIKKIIETYQSERLLHEFLTSTNHYYQYWALDKVMDKNGNIPVKYAKDIRQIISGKNVFTARYALQKSAPSFFQTDDAQSWLWQTYSSAGYMLQIAILKKLTHIPLTSPLTESLAQQLVKANNEQFNLMLVLLKNQKKLSPKTLRTMADQLENSNTDYAEGIYDLLQNHYSADASIKGKLETYKAGLSDTGN